MHSRLALFVAVITIVLSLGAYYVGHRFLLRRQFSETHRRVVWLSLVLFVVLQVLGPLLYRVVPWFGGPDSVGSGFILHWVTYTTLGVFACMVFYTVAVDIVAVVWRRLRPQTDEVELGRRSFLAIGGMVATSSVLGVAQAVQGPKVYEVNIPIEGLPEGLEGFKIAQISDLHVGPTIGRDYAENVVRMTNELAPDLIALTGDFIDGTVDQLRSGVEPLSRLQSTHGSYFVTGNHEYYWEPLEWLEHFKSLGMRVLLNEHVVVDHKGSRFVLAGVTDYKAGETVEGHKSDPRKSLEGAPGDLVKVLLAHQPASYAAASDAGFHVQLSGHTHAGQFFPWSITVQLAQRYYKGLNRHEKMWVYVNRGTGYWGPPLRFTVPAEVTLLRLVRG